MTAAPPAEVVAARTVEGGREEEGTPADRAVGAAALTWFGESGEEGTREGEESVETPAGSAPPTSASLVGSVVDADRRQTPAAAAHGRWVAEENTRGGGKTARKGPMIAWR